MGVALAGVHYHQLPAAESQGHRLDHERREVDHQRCVGFAEQRRELVEQARSRANPLALHARAQLRDLQAVKLRAAATAQRSEGEAERDPERRRGGKTGAAPKIAADLKPCSAGGKSGRAELGHHAAHERPPAARRRAVF